MNLSAVVLRETDKFNTALHKRLLNGEVPDNTSPMLAQLFIAQEQSKHWDKQERSAWKDLTAMGLLADDDILRDNPGETLVLDGQKFTVVTRVAKPRTQFDQSEFIERAVSELKVPRSKLVRLMNECVKSGKAPLTKIVLPKG